MDRTVSGADVRSPLSAPIDPSGRRGFDELLADRKGRLDDPRYADQVAAIVGALVAAFRRGNKVLWFGNGGSAADAQHLAAEFSGRFLRERKGLPSEALTVNTSAVTAISNDFGYEHLFARMVEALAKPGDVVVGITTSGTSKNVVRGLEAAKTRRRDDRRVQRQRRRPGGRDRRLRADRPRRLQRDRPRSAHHDGSHHLRSGRAGADLFMMLASGQLDAKMKRGA